jgi:transcriptional regulator with XRE-family HTH domain
MELGASIIMNRKKLGLSQEKFADLMNVARPTISSWETNTTMPDISNIKKMAGIFMCSIDELVGSSNPTLTPAGSEALQGEKTA